MVITFGCVFVEIAQSLSSTDITGNVYYDWENKQTFPLSQEALDALIFTLSNQDTECFIEENNFKFSFTMDNSGYYTLYNHNDLLLSNDLSLVQVNGLRIMLEQAKIKTYGWN